MKKNILLVILLYSVVHAQFSSVDLDRYTINEGLSNNAINSVLQTSDNYLWIATKDGLNRFDGQSFKVFKADEKIKNSLPENYIMCLLESKSGKLWLGTWGAGLCWYDKVYEKFISLKENNTNDYIQCLYEDEAGNIWYGTENNGIKKYDILRKKIFSFDRLLQSKLKITSKNITAIISDKKKNLWFASLGGGLIKYNAKQNKIEQILSQGITNSLKSNFIWELVNETDSTLLIGTSNGLQRFNIYNNNFSNLDGIGEDFPKILNTTISRILIENSKKIWIGTYNYQGLFVYEKTKYDKTNLIHLLNEYGNSTSLICNRIRCLYKDKLDNIWIGTEDGLNKFAKKKKFTCFKNLPHKQNSLSGNVVSSILQPDNNFLYVGFGGNGFDKIDLVNNRIEHFKASTNSNTGLSNDDITCMIKDKNNVIWIGTSNGGLNKFYPDKKIFKSFLPNSKNPYSINSYWVQQILETSDDKLLVGTNDGLQIFDRHDEKFYPYQPVKKKNGTKLPDNFSVNSLYEDKEKNIWIGTWLNGLFRYVPDKDLLINYLPNNQHNSISGNKVSCIYQDSKGFIWIGTFNNGLNKFDKYKNVFKHYKTSNGLPNDIIFGILEDDKNNLWLSTLNGLVKFNPANESFRIYEKDDGLVDNQFNWHAYYKNDKGEMFFGGKGGFVQFIPDSISIDRKIYPVVLTNFKVFDKEASLQKSLPMTKEIILDSHQNFFSIDFAVLDLVPKHKHKFAYMLEGIDPDWVQAGFRNTAFYTDIKHGRYKFNIKALNADGIWSPVTSIIIQIFPAWYETIWFKISIITLTFSILYLGYRYRMNQLLKIERIRYNIATDLHDEIGSNLSSISVDSQLLLMGNKLDENEKELASEISKTAGETVDSMRDIIWFINPKNDLNEDIIFKMKQTAAKLLSAVEWDFYSSENVRMDLFDLETRRNIFLLYKEALTNIIKHSHATKCKIKIEENSDYFKLTLEDNGIGFDKKISKPSTGLKSMENRAKYVNGNLDIISEKNLGTTIILMIKK
ncbi:MAG: hypothetical protein Fur0015_00500 [Ignavibacteriales bacterium]